MSVAVAEAKNLQSNDTNTGWITQPVHGNSKRQCQIRRNRQACGNRATHVTTSSKAGKRERYTQSGVLPIYHCDDPRHSANAHKQVTELNNTF